MKTIPTLLIAASALMAGCTPTRTRHADSKRPGCNATAQTTDREAQPDTANTPGKVERLTAAEFRRRIMDYEAHTQDWAYEGSRPAVIDFYATWCRPCKMMSPVVETMAKAYAGKIDFYKVDIDKETELAAVFGIQSIPTFLLIPAKGKPTIMQGAMQKSEFERAIRETLAQ